MKTLAETNFFFGKEGPPSAGMASTSASTSAAGGGGAAGRRVVRVGVHQVDRVAPDPRVVAPLVRVYVVDPATGEVLKRQSTEVLCAESDLAQGLPQDPNALLDHVPRMDSRACSLRDSMAAHARLAAVWDEEFVVYEEADRLLAAGALLFFELCQVSTMDFRPPASLWHRIQNTSGVTSIAWAFLKLKGRQGTANLGEDLRLQLFTCPRRAAVPAQGLPVYHWWKQGQAARLAKYPSALHVSVASVPAVVQARPAGPSQPSALAPPTKLYRKTVRPKEAAPLGPAGAGPSSEASATRYTTYLAREPYEECLIPNASSSHVDGPARGCTVLKFSHSGNHLAVAGGDALTFSVRVVAVHSSEVKTVLPGHHEYVYDLCWAPDDSALVSASSDFTAKVWNPFPGPDGESVRCVLQHSAFVYAAKFHPKAAAKLVFTGAYDHRIRAWDAESGQLLHAVASDKGPVQALAIEPEGKRLFSGDAQGVIKEHSCDPNVGKRGNLQLLREANDLEGESVLCMELQPTGRKLFVMTKKNRLCAVDAKHLVLTKFYPGVRTMHLPLRFCVSPDGKYLLSGSEDGKVFVWHVDSAQVKQLPQMGNSVHQVCATTWSPAEHVVATCTFAPQRPISFFAYDQGRPAVAFDLRGAQETHENKHVRFKKRLDKLRASTQDRIENKISSIKARVSQSYERQVFTSILNADGAKSLRY